MSIAVAQGVIYLSGTCGAGDVEPLLTTLLQNRQLVVDVTDAEHLNAAIFQLLQALRAEIRGSARDTFVRTWLIPILQSGQGRLTASPLPAERL